MNPFLTFHLYKLDKVLVYQPVYMGDLLNKCGSVEKYNNFTLGFNHGPGLDDRTVLIGQRNMGTNKVEPVVRHFASNELRDDYAVQFISAIISTIANRFPSKNGKTNYTMEVDEQSRYKFEVA